MNISILKIDELRDIYAASFVERHPYYFSSKKVDFVPPHHFLYFHLQGNRSMTLDGEKYDFETGDIFLFHAGRHYLSFTYAFRQYTGTSVKQY